LQLSLLRLPPTVLLAATVRPLSLAALSAFSVVTAALAPALEVTVTLPRAFPRTAQALARVMLPQALEQALVAQDLETLLHTVPARVMLEQALEVPLELLAMPLVMLERAWVARARAMLLQASELARALVAAQRVEPVSPAMQDLELVLPAMQVLELERALEVAQREEPVLMAQATQDLELEQASVATQREELVATAQAMLLPALERALVAVQTQELTAAPVLAAFFPA
jgi:hypothetical protein